MPLRRVAYPDPPQPGQDQKQNAGITLHLPSSAAGAPVDWPTAPGVPGVRSLQPRSCVTVRRVHLSQPTSLGCRENMAPS